MHATWTATNSPARPVFGEPVTDPIQRAQILKRLELLGRLLDDAILLPGTSYRIGWDGIIGLVPGFGDAATTLLSAYIVWEAMRLGVSKRTLAKMAANVGADLLFGAIPVLGDLWDVAWKANRRNLALLNRWLDEQAREQGGSAQGLHLISNRSSK
jgi:hypothetical protein